MGPNIKNGQFDIETHERNMEAAVETYIERVDGSPICKTNSKLYKGNKDKDMKERRDLLVVFLKDSEREKRNLRTTKTETYNEFMKICKIGERRQVVDLSDKYLFILKCGYESDCLHPSCQSGKPTGSLRLYPNGPELDFIPLNVVDNSRPWGNDSCPSCKELFGGHYLPSETLYQQWKNGDFVPVKHPSVIISDAANKGLNMDVDQIESIVIMSCLSVADISFG